jgi:hypothetical protein
VLRWITMLSKQPIPVTRADQRFSTFDPFTETLQTVPLNVILRSDALSGTEVPVKENVHSPAVPLISQLTVESSAVPFPEPVIGMPAQLAENVMSAVVGPVGVMVWVMSPHGPLVAVVVRQVPAIDASVFDGSDGVDWVHATTAQTRNASVVASTVRIEAV